MWFRSSLARYYPVIDELVVLVPEDGRGWTGLPIPVAACLEIVEEIDLRRISRQVRGRWTDQANPMRADTAQRQAGLDALAGRVDWVLQIDNDEVLPDVEAVLRAVKELPFDVVGVEWPMRVLYRHLGGHSWAAVAGAGGEPVVEYPGCVVVRPTARLVDARRPGEASVQRMVVVGDVTSLQVCQPPVEGEIRVEGLPPEQAIWHNSWGRSPAEIWRKTRTWGHAAGVKGVAYFLLRWLPSKWLWRRSRDFHPFAQGLWPALRPVTIPSDLLDDRDLPQTKRFA